MKIKLALSLLLCPVLWMGCATTPHTVDASQKLVSMKVDTQDCKAIAEKMVQSMLTSPALDRAAHKPAVLVVARVRNDTATQLDTDLVTKSIRIALSQSGKTVTDVTGGAMNDPDFNLSGKISDTYVRQGDNRQHTYTYQMSLTTPQGLAVWEDEREITKQGSKGAVDIW